MQRTDLDRFSTPPKPLSVVLGGREFQIAIQKKGRTAQFRKKLMASLGSIEELGAALSGLAAAADPDVVVPVSSLPVQQIVGAVLGFMGEGSATLLNLIYEYDTALADERDWIEENAYEQEVCVALLALVKVVYGPFLDVLLSGMKTMATAETDAE